MKKTELEELRRRARILHQRLNGNLVRGFPEIEVQFIVDAMRELIDDEREANDYRE